MAEEIYEEQDIYTLTDEEGNEVEFELIDSVDYQDDEYLILLPLEEDAEEVTILKVIPNADGSESYVTVDTEETLLAVFEVFKAHFAENFESEE